MNEFEIIQHYFMAQNLNRSDVICGIGDDAALLQVPPDHELAVSTDTLIAGRHFPLETCAQDIAYKALAVNLSDLAAMGAKPTWFSLALTVEQADHSWLQAFCSSLFELANQYELQLIGGDTTRGPLSITISIMGIVPIGQALKRAQAKAGDLIYVSGYLGDAGLGLRGHYPPQFHEYFQMRLNRPQARVDLGIALRNIAHAAIDISDGLAADLQHILKRSQVGAEIIVAHLPLSPAIKESVKLDEAIELALCAGDDYELCFTVAQNKLPALATIETNSCGLTCIGRISNNTGLVLLDHNGRRYHGTIQGYQHF